MFDAETSMLRVTQRADRAPVASVPVDQADRVAAVTRPYEPPNGGRRLPLADRLRWIADMRDWLVDNDDRLVGLLHAEAARVRAEPAIEIPWICEVIGRYCRLAQRLLARRKVAPGMPLMRL